MFLLVGEKRRERLRNDISVRERWQVSGCGEISSLPAKLTMGQCTFLSGPEGTFGPVYLRA